MYIATYPRTKTIYLEDLPTQQSSPFRRLSSTIRSHQNDCGRLRDRVSACGMRYRNHRRTVSLAVIVDSQLLLCYDDCTRTKIIAANTEVPRLAYEFDAFIPTYCANEALNSAYASSRCTMEIRFHGWQIMETFSITGCYGNHKLLYISSHT